MGQLAVEMTANEVQAYKAMQRLIDQQAKMEQGLKRTGRASASAGKKNDAAFGAGALSSLKTYVAGFMGVGGLMMAIQAVNRELEHTKQLQKDVASEQITLASARKDITRNMAGASDEDIKKMMGAATSIAGETNVEEKFIAQAIASALSASGGKQDASIAAVKGAAQFLADKPEEIAGFAGSLLDLSKITGTDDAAVNQGLLQQVGALSRVVDPALQASNIPKSLIGQQSFGATAQEAAAMFAAITNASGDLTGARSGTAAVGLAQQLRDFFKEEGLTAKAEKSLGRSLSMGERIEMLQGDQKLAGKFLEGASFEKAAAGPIEQLLTNVGSVMAAAFRENQGKIGSNDELAELAKKSIQQRFLDPLEQTAALDRAFKDAQSGLTMGDVETGRAGAIRENLSETFRRSGMGAHSLKMKEKAFDLQVGLGADPTQLAIEQLEQEAEKRLSTGGTVADISASGPFGQLRETRRTVTDDDKSDAAILMEMVETLKSIDQNTKAANTDGAQGAAPLNRNAGTGAV